MTEQELRKLLPGSGDLAEMVRETIEEDGEYDFEFSDELGKYLLDKILDWVMNPGE